MPSVKRGDRYWDKYQYLLAMKLGEFTEFAIKPTSAEKRLQTPRTSREAYRHITNAITVLHQQQNKVRFKVRVGDWDNPRTLDTVRIYCTRIGDETFEPPPTKGGFRAVVIEHKKQLEAAAELPKQIEAAREEAKPVPHDPPNIIKTTKDAQKRLVNMVTAFARGEAVQYITNGKWKDVDRLDLMLTIDPMHLRLKPPPRREMWALFSRDGASFIAKPTRAEFKDVDQALLVHYREVLPGDEDDE